MLLGPDDPVGMRPRRIVVNGGSGAGKSTFARAIAAALDLPYTEMDSLYHGPGWSERESFLDDVRAFGSGDRWVCEFQYDTARPDLPVVRLRNAAEASRWFDRLSNSQL